MPAMASTDDHSAIHLGRELYARFGRRLSSARLLNSELSAEIAGDDVDREE